MVDRLHRWWDELRSSYWFIPALMTLGALGLAIAVPWIDASLGSEWIDGWTALGPNQPEGARSLLSTVAGSMITVGGVAFSVTIAAVAYATSQYGPRLLTNFMRDTGNQITLGTFTATYLYCVVVLRIIRSSGADDVSQAFVPHLSILLALLLALVSLGVLIYFFHHVPESIHAENVVGQIGRQLESRVTELFPSRFETEDDDADDGPDESAPGVPSSPATGAASPPGDLDPGWTPVTLEGGGYLQFVAEGRLREIAERLDITVRVDVTPGAFTHDGDPVCHVWPASKLPDDARSELVGCFSRGRRRTDQGDVIFLTQELVEITARALSPGIYDPFTAINCIDWIANGLAIAARGERRDPSGGGDRPTPRVLFPTRDFDQLAEVGLAGIRTYAATDRNAALHLATTLRRLVAGPVTDHARRVVDAHAELFLAACERGLTHDADIRAVRVELGVEPTSR